MSDLPFLHHPNVRRAVSVGVTLAAVAAAAWACTRLWDRYELQPWTRDGRVRANVVQIAPDVSGLVTRVAVHDNQRVKAGELLFEIDPVRYRLAEHQAETLLSVQKVTLAQAQREAQRNAGLGELVSTELREQSRTRVEQARAAVEQAALSLQQAQLNLERAQVHAPCDGVITNLDLRQGGYASTGHPALALVDAGSMYVEGYFEETKLPRIHLGERAQVRPMGFGVTLSGRVESLAAGIADHDRATGTDLLPAVNPSFNWVRLPQRVPVRIHLDPLPDGVRLVAGQTVSVELEEAQQAHDARPAAPPATSPSGPQAARASGAVGEART